MAHSTIWESGLCDSNTSSHSPEDEILAGFDTPLQATGTHSSGSEYFSETEQKVAAALNQLIRKYHIDDTNIIADRFPSVEHVPVYVPSFDRATGAWSHRQINQELCPKHII